MLDMGVDRAELFADWFELADEDGLRQRRGGQAGSGTERDGTVHGGEG